MLWSYRRRWTFSRRMSAMGGKRTLRTIGCPGQAGARMSKFHIQIAVQHPVLFLSDPTVEETVPPDTGAAIVTATEDCICFWVQPYVDGETQVTISDQPCEDGIACFSGTISTPGKVVALSNSKR